MLEHRTPWANDLFKAITYLGGGVVANLVILAAVVVYLARGGHRRRVGIVVLAMILGSLTRSWLNAAIARPRPAPADWLVSAGAHAMPSGHSSNSVLAYGLVLVVFGYWRWRAVAVVVLIALGVGISRLYLGVHWPTDVLAGWAFGAAWVAAAALSVRELESMPRRRRG